MISAALLFFVFHGVSYYREFSSIEECERQITSLVDKKYMFGECHVVVRVEGYKTQRPGMDANPEALLGKKYI